MTYTVIDEPPTSVPEAPLRAPVSKAATVAKLLSRNRGATLDEIMATTSWQPHSTRAFLSGLRKKGMVLIKEARKSGETSYRCDS